MEVRIPDELTAEFLQVMRDFDMKYDPEHEDKVQVRMLSQSELSVDKVNAIFDTITPTPHFRTVLRFKDNEPV